MPASPPRLVIERLEAPSRKAVSPLPAPKTVPRAAPASAKAEDSGPHFLTDDRTALFRVVPGKEGKGRTIKQMADEAAQVEARRYTSNILHDPAYAKYFHPKGKTITDFWCDQQLSGGRAAPTAPAGPLLTFSVDFNRMLYRLAGKVMDVNVNQPLSYERLVALFRSGQIQRMAFRDYFHQLYDQFQADPRHRQVVLVPMAGAELSPDEEVALAPLRSAKSALVALYLDVEIRRVTSGRVTLEQVDRELAAFVQTRSAAVGPEPIPGSRFRLSHLSQVERATGQSFIAFFRDYVFGAAELPNPGPYLDALEVAWKK